MDVLIAFLVVGFPFLMGGREAWGHCVLISAALLLGGAWCLHRVVVGGRLVLTGAEVLLVAAFALLWLQTASLSPTLLEQVSPEYPRLLEGWAETQGAAPSGSESETLGAETSAAETPGADTVGAEPVWRTLSFLPVETRHAVWVLLAYAVIGLVVAQRVQSAEDAEWMLRLVAISGTAMAAFAAVQFMTSNGRFFWFYRNPYTGTDEILKGAFTNRNHFAQFLTVSLGPLLWWFVTLRRKQDASFNPQQQHTSSGESLFDRVASVPLLMAICATGGVLVCILLSLSRGGMVAAAVACLVCLTILSRQRQFRASVPMMMLVLGGLAIGGLLVFGSQDVETRVDQLASADANNIDQMNCRRAIWTADWEAIRRFPLFGTGIGSHREVYPIYMTDLADFTEFEFTHAESTWIHLALEAGFTGVGLLALGLLLVTGRIGLALLRTRGEIRRDCLAPVVAVIAAGSLHAVVDFIWYVPAIVVVTLVICATGLRVASGFEPSRGVLMPRPVWLVAGLACVAALAVAQPHLWQRIRGERWWHAYLVATFDDRDGSTEDAGNAEFALPESSVEDPAAMDVPAATAADPAEAATDSDAERAAARRRRTESLKHRIGLLMRSLRENPDQPRAQIRMASLCLKLFDRIQQDAENPMSLAEIRDTAVSAGFESPAELHEWLERAFGRTVRLARLADQLARRALRACPIQGPAYLTLLETGFLRDPADPHHAELLDAVLTIRGYDPRTQFVAGQLALYAGDQPRALRHWGRVFHANREFRESITYVLARAVPASLLMLEFEPSVVELREVLAAYSEQNRRPEIEQILHEAARLSAQEDSSATTEDRVALLMDGYKVAWNHGLPETAEDLLRRAIDCDDLAYWPRHALGLLLYERERYDEASEQFAWCYRQQPGDTNLSRLIRESRNKARQQQMRVIRTAWPAPEDPLGAGRQ